MDRVPDSPDVADLTTPLPGRDRELRELARLLDRTIQASGAVILISGEAGIGKTTLTERLAAQASRRGALVLVGNCYRTTNRQPFAPWLEIHHILRRALPEHIDESFSMRAISSETPDSSEELFERTVQELRQASEKQPLVVIVEDIHWADRASLDLLRYVARQASSLPLLLVATCREDEPEPAGSLPDLLPDLIRESRAHRFELRRLGLSDALDFLTSNWLHSAKPVEETVQALGKYLHNRSEGNPFYMTELWRDLTREGSVNAGSLPESIDLETLPVPSLVRQVIENRVRRMSSDGQTLLSTAAIIGQDVPIDLWQGVTGAADHELASVIEEAVRNFLLRESRDGESVKFLHGLIQETLYHDQVTLRRRGIHQQIAERLASQPAPVPDAVAHHFERAGDDRASEWLVRSAERALDVYAARDAIRMIDRAEVLARRAGNSLPRAGYRVRGLAREILGETDQALQDYQALLKVARDAGELSLECQTLVDLGLLWAGQDYEKSGEYLSQAHEIATRLGNDRLQAQCLNRLGNWQANTGQLDPAIELHKQALATFESIEDQDGIADTLDLLGSTNFLAGNYRASVDWYDRAIAQSRKLNDRRRLSSSLANLAIIAGDFDVSFDASVAATRVPEAWIGYGEEAVQIAREIGWKSGESFALAMLGSIVAVRGDVGRGLRLVTEAHDLARRLDHLQWLACTAVILGSIWSELFDPSRATFYFERGRALAQSVKSQFWSILLDSALATLKAETGDGAGARALLEPWASLNAPVTSHAYRVFQFGRARVHLTTGEAAHALQIADELLAMESTPSSEVAGIPQVLKLRADALAMLDRIDEADLAYRDAASSAAILGYRGVEWQILRDWGRMALIQRRIVQAGELFDRAEEAVREIAGTIGDPETRERFHSRAGDTIHAARTAVSPDRAVSGLSPRQFEVLSLVALGMTDAQVADRLFISPRTVARHLQSIYNHFGVNSRTAAVTIAYERRLIEPPGEQGADQQLS